MRKLKSIILTAALVLAAGTANAQFDETNNLFYHTIRTPQSNLLNPAFHPAKNTFYLMLPGVDFQFGMPLALNDVLRYDKASKTTIINVDSILHTLSEDNQFRMGANVQLLGFGLKIKHLYLNLNLRLCNGFSIGLPISTVNALLEGNIGDDGVPHPEVKLLNGDIFNLQSYIESSVGAAFHIDKLNLTVGVHAKLLSGVLNIQTDKTHLTLHSDEDLDRMTVRAYYELQGSAVVPYDTSQGKFLFNGPEDILNNLLANSGLAFDVGARWDLGPLSLSLAVNNITKGIHWTKNTYAFVPENGQGEIYFDGVNINTVLNDGQFYMDSISDYFKERIDGMKPRFVNDTNGYWFPIPTTFNLGASYSFAHLFRAGLLFHGQLDRGLFSTGSIIDGFEKSFSNTFRFNTTLSVSVNLFNWLEVVAGSSVVYDGKHLDAFNPGAGVILSLGGAMQTYVMADYISSIRLVESKACNIKFGCNLLIGKGGKKKVSGFDPVAPILTPNEE